MNDLEKVLQNAKDESVFIPQKFTDAIKISLYGKNDNKWRKLYMKKRILEIASVCTCCMLLVGVAFSKDISAFVQNIFGANSSDGVGMAVGNGYVESVKTDYQSADGIEVKIDTFMMDDFNFMMNFKLRVDDKYNIDDFKSVEFEDLRIVDEMENTVFVTHPYDEKLEYKGSYSFLANKDNERELTISLSATGNPEAFPKSKKLKINFSKILTKKLVYINGIENKETKGFSGNWKFDVDVPEEFYNRESFVYNVKSCNDESTIVTKAIVSNTAMKIELTTSRDNEMALQKEYVEISSGEKFETAQRSDGDGGYSMPDGKDIIYYWQTFNLTTFDVTDEISVHIFTNGGKEIVINLERNK